ncbi:hypothetical protein LXL04_003544 [Taraxacum kok-saghyz]
MVTASRPVTFESAKSIAIRLTDQNFGFPDAKKKEFALGVQTIVRNNGFIGGFRVKIGQIDIDHFLLVLVVVPQRNYQGTVPVKIVRTGQFLPVKHTQKWVVGVMGQNWRWKRRRKLPDSMAWPTHDPVDFDIRLTSTDSNTEAPCLSDSMDKADHTAKKKDLFSIFKIKALVYQITYLVAFSSNINSILAANLEPKSHQVYTVTPPDQDTGGNVRGLGDVIQVSQHIHT